MLTYLFLSLLLGIRHGLDPDHIAIINGINLNSHSRGKASLWNGFFFSLGHGVTVTLIGILVILLHNRLDSQTPIFELTEWVPIILLLFTGTYGLYSIYSDLKMPNHSVHSHPISAILAKKSHFPHLKLFVIGLLFALVFDTSTQVAAWGLIGSEQSQNKYLTASLIGLFFTIGMILSDTCNGVLFYKLLNVKGNQFSFKLYVTTLVALSSLILGLMQLSNKLGFHAEIPDIYKFTWGLVIMVATIIGFLIHFFQLKKPHLKS